MAEGTFNTEPQPHCRSDDQWEIKNWQKAAQLSFDSCQMVPGGLEAVSNQWPTLGNPWRLGSTGCSSDRQVALMNGGRINTGWRARLAT